MQDYVYKISLRKGYSVHRLLPDSRKRFIEYFPFYGTI